jgi:ribosome-binding factor A
MVRKRRQGPSQRQLRVGEALRHALADILARGELRDPELAGLQVTVTEVRVSPDLRAATAFVVPFGGGDAAALAKALNRATGFFRMRLTDAVELRVAPTVHFAPDLSFDKADRIEKLLHDPSVIRDLKKDAPEDNGNGA